MRDRAGGPSEGTQPSGTGVGAARGRCPVFKQKVRTLRAARATEALSGSEMRGRMKAADTHDLRLICGAGRVSARDRRRAAEAPSRTVSRT